MRPTEILKDEHRVIEQVLDALEALAAQAARAGRLDAPAAQDALEFFRIFADKVHHGKEEAHLFLAMEAKGFPRHGGPTGVMLAEHDEGRGHVRAMAALIEPASEGDAAAIGRFGDHASEFARLLREHIQKEDHCLFGMADSAFSESDQTLLRAAFDRAEREEIEAGLRERGLALAQSLTARSGVECGC
jgi:hemerythrin-like domain-containing protein